MSKLAPALATPPFSPDAVRSTIAYLLPQGIMICTGTAGRVVETYVRPNQFVLRGEDIAQIEPLTGSRFVLKAHASGRVTRCWVAAGQLVSAAQPIVSLLERDNVLVLALFEKRHLDQIPLTRPRITFEGLSVPPTSARIIRFGRDFLSVRGSRVDSTDGLFRVLLRIATVPEQALRPGVQTIVEFPWSDR